MNWTPEQVADAQRRIAENMVPKLGSRASSIESLKSLAAEAIYQCSSKRRGPNKWEQAYADHLEMQKRAGDIQWYAFEWIRLRLANDAWYKPDFFVFTNEDEIEAHEVKGHFREAAKVRLKVAADRYPFQFVLVTRDKNSGEWVFNRLK